MFPPYKRSNIVQNSMKNWISVWRRCQGCFGIEFWTELGTFLDTGNTRIGPDGRQPGISRLGMPLRMADPGQARVSARPIRAEDVLPRPHSGRRFWVMFCVLLFSALSTLLRGNFGRIFGSRIGQKSMKKGCSRHWLRKCRFSDDFLIHFVYFHFKLEH